MTQTQCFKNLSAVLEEAGSSLKNVVRVGVFLTDMANFAAMNTVYETFFDDPKPVCSLMSFILVFLLLLPTLALGQE